MFIRHCYMHSERSALKEMIFEKRGFTCIYGISVVLFSSTRKEEEDTFGFGFWILFFTASFFSVVSFTCTCC